MGEEAAKRERSLVKDLDLRLTSNQFRKLQDSSPVKTFVAVLSFQLCAPDAICAIQNDPRLDLS